jgi:hypothetical protein
MEGTLSKSMDMLFGLIQLFPLQFLLKPLTWLGWSLVKKSGLGKVCQEESEF